MKISIDKAKAGMKVAEDVINEAGMIIIPKGKELTEILINKLSQMNIKFIYVEGKRELPPKNEIFEGIERRFKKIKDPQTLLIKMVLKSHIEELYESSGSNGES
ncbi:MAG: hypothetical protein ABDH16_03605 [Thermodesulfovibrionaceae bacterium]